MPWILISFTHMVAYRLMETERCASSLLAGPTIPARAVQRTGGSRNTWIGIVLNTPLWVTLRRLSSAFGIYLQFHLTSWPKYCAIMTSILPPAATTHVPTH